MKQTCSNCPHLKSARSGFISYRYWCGLTGDGYNGKATKELQEERKE